MARGRGKKVGVGVGLTGNPKLKIGTIPANGKVLHVQKTPTKVQQNFFPGDVKALADIRKKPVPPTRGF